MISRRQFLKGAAGGAVGVAAAGALASCGLSGKDVKFDKKVDVIVVGSGGAGVAAALQAASDGASVLILEKAGLPGGTTNYSGGVMQAAGTDFQKALTPYQDDTPEKHFQLWLAAGEGFVDEALVKDLAYGAPGHIEWLKGLGLKFTSVYGHCHIPSVDKALFADRIHVYEGGGAEGSGTILIQTILKAAKEKGVTLDYNAEVTNLITNENGMVIGVSVKQKGNVYNVKATKGVILATGGIDKNLEMAKLMSPQQYWDLTSGQCLCAATNTGDGIRMAMGIGAGVAGLGGTIDFCGKTGAATDNRVPLFPSFIVNQKGRRFVCEDATYAYHYRAIFEQEKQLAGHTYMIFAESSIADGKAPWNKDSASKDVAAGTLVKADSIEALARAIGVPASNLAQTLATWNNDAKTGKDTQFDRLTGIKSLSGPFYAYKNVSFNLGALGGVRISVDTEALKVDGSVIPHLYVAGLNAGGWIGPYYPGSGTAIMGLMHWGRKAGANAAKQTAV